jgi:hypothetical protein
MPTAETPCWERDSEIVEKWERPTKRDEDIELKAEIDRAKKILELTDDWDGEGTAPYSKASLDRAINFLSAHSIKGYALCSYYPPAPKIGPGPNGSVDLHWKRKTWELLVNIPADDAQMAVFYGDDYGVSKIKGSFDPTTVNLGIVAWLMR